MTLRDSVLTPDAFFDSYGNRRPFSRRGAEFAWRLAGTAYNMRLQAWRDAGFGDFSCRINGHVLTGEDLNGGDSLREDIGSLYQSFMARARMRYTSPFAQIKKLRSSEGGSAKAVCMAMDAGEYTLIAIGFTGTCRRLDDWMPNLDVQTEEGYHRGFFRLAQEIFACAEEVTFPATAKRMGLKSLTLAEILTACTEKNCPFRIVMAGHSQGAAVMQIFTQELAVRGARRELMAGVGFASPSVTSIPRADAAECLTHLISSDDAIPRIGATKHIGRCYILPVNDAVRAICYGARCQDETFCQCLKILSGLRTTRDALLFFICVQQMMLRKHVILMNDLIPGKLERAIPGTILDALESRVDRSLERMLQHTVDNYLTLTRQSSVPQTVLQRFTSDMDVLAQRFGEAETALNMIRAITCVHRLGGWQEEQRAPYEYMVHEGFDHLIYAPEGILLSPLFMPMAIPRTPSPRRNPNEARHPQRKFAPVQIRRDRK